MDHQQTLLSLFDRYCAATGLSEARVSTLVLNGGWRAEKIRRGASFTVRTYERALAWFSANWPEKTEWPAEVERPASQESAA